MNYPRQREWQFGDAKAVKPGNSYAADGFAGPDKEQMKQTTGKKVK